MKIHIISGFLGSGKTTAIRNSAKLLISQKQSVGVITNDQGKYLVDSQFMDMAGIPNSEVTGGCFCCNYNALDEQINSLYNIFKPSHIFAESVGSCTDLIATVVNPLTRYAHYHIEAITYSVFVDANMLLQFARDIQLPFNDDTNYIWQKQLEESEILVVNKCDLLSEKELMELKRFTAKLESYKIILYQNSLNTESIEKWINVLQTQSVKTKRETIQLDYTKYGAGEAHLAWLDEEVVIESDDEITVNTANNIIHSIILKVRELNLPIGHVKFMIKTPDGSQKISFTTITDNTTENRIRLHEASSLHLAMNARVQTTPEKLRLIVADTISEFNSQSNIRVIEQNISYFTPGFPNPTHRLTDQAK
ncbi:MAG: CobW-like GTP-binding protein [Ignavibacteria bacterium]|nr:CobW-like GTP-binding protein [Ignavibacteria bacterium]